MLQLCDRVPLFCTFFHALKAGNGKISMTVASHLPHKKTMAFVIKNFLPQDLNFKFSTAVRHLQLQIKLPPNTAVGAITRCWKQCSINNDLWCSLVQLDAKCIFVFVTDDDGDPDDDNGWWCRWWLAMITTGPVLLARWGCLFANALSGTLAKQKGR